MEAVKTFLWKHRWAVFVFLGFTVVKILEATLRIEFIVASAYVGIILLSLSLVPPYFKSLGVIARHKRHLGIAAGIILIVHGYTGFSLYLGGDVAQIWQKAILPAEIIQIVLIAMLATSGAWPQKKLGLSGWKTIHAAIWAAIPLAFMHAYLVVQKFEGVIHYPSLVILGGLFLFAVWKLVFLPHPDRKQDVLMLATGSILACLIFFTLP